MAQLQYRLLSERPYELTEEELYVRVYGLRLGLAEPEIEGRYDALHRELYARPQACMRGSPLTKRYGFGAHYDEGGRIGLHPRESEAYRRLANQPGLRQLTALRNTRS